jgi:anti-sigma factor RsiW
MSCKEIDNLLPAYEEDLLTPEEKKGIEAHLASCERCRRSLADFRRAQELVRGLGEVEPPPFFEERIMARVRQEAGEKRGLLRRLFYPLHIKIPIQALATVLITVLAFQLYQQGDPEMKRVAPFPVPLTEPAKEPAAAEPRGAAGAPEAAAPARLPAGDLPGATGQRFAAPPPEGGGMREKMADSAAVREERPADVIREDRRAPETPPPERMAKTADPATQVLGMEEMEEEGVGQREGGKSETSGRAALMRETGRAPASPVPERQAKAKTADAGIAAGEDKPMPAATDPGQAAASGAIGRSAVELTIQVADVRRAMQEIEKLLEEANARIIERRRRGEGEFLRAEMAAGRVAPLLGQLAAIGRVKLGKGLPGLPEGIATIGITIESRPEP